MEVLVSIHKTLSESSTYAFFIQHPLHFNTHSTVWRTKIPDFISKLLIDFIAPLRYLVVRSQTSMRGSIRAHLEHLKSRAIKYKSKVVSLC